MHPAFKSITFEATGDNVMNCKFAVSIYSPWFSDHCHGKPFHMPASHAKRRSFQPAAETRSAVGMGAGLLGRGEGKKNGSLAQALSSM